MPYCIILGLLEEELDAHLLTSETLPPSLLMSVRASLSEVRSAHSRADNLAFERDKLRADLTEANQRAIVLAQEIDDQNARLEKASQQRVRYARKIMEGCVKSARRCSAKWRNFWLS